MRTTALVAALPLAAATPTWRAPLHVRSTDALEDKYIVMMKKGPQINGGLIGSILDGVVSSIAAEADHVFNTFGGFAASLTTDEVEALRSNPNVCTFPRRA